MSQEEFDAFQNSRALWKRLWRLAGFGTHRDRQMIATRALRSLAWAEIDCLFSAHGAERQGRELTVEERAARVAYTEALTKASLGAGYTSVEGFEKVLTVPDLLMGALGYVVGGELLKLADRARKAPLEGRTASQEEADALKNCNALCNRFVSLAFGEPTEAEPATQVPCSIDDETGGGSEAREEPAAAESDHGSEIDAEVVTIGGGSSELEAGPEKSTALKENPYQDSLPSWESYPWDR
jgi:hypothetical protein